MKIVMLAAGKGQRFQDDVAIKYPAKPLIEINGVPMWQYVLDNFLSNMRDTSDCTAYVITREEYGIEHHNVINLTGRQFGAAYSALEALKQFSDSDEELVIMNVDQLITFDYEDFDSLRFDSMVDGALFHFYEPELKYGWGRSIRDSSADNILGIVEKIPVSPWAHTGHYYFRKTSDFVKYADKLIQLNIKVLDEFFLSPIYNLMIADKKSIHSVNVESFIPLGIPQELERYIKGGK